MSAKFRVLGVNDDAADCECCGRQGLKRVMWLQPLDEDGNDIGSPLHFGMTCGAKAAGWGYGSDLGRIERRLRKEEQESRKFYGAKCSQIINQLVASGRVVVVAIACSFDLKLACYNYGKIYALPGDRITTLPPADQHGECWATKTRLRQVYPVFMVCDGTLTAAQLRELAGGAA